MIQFIDRYFISSDARGSIEGLINKGCWEELNYITSEKGSIRGNHYHKHTKEVFVILSGRILVSVQKISDGKLVGEKKTYYVGKGKVFLIEPMVNHIFIIEETAEWLNLLSCRIDEKQPDIYRL